MKLERGKSGGSQCGCRMVGMLMGCVRGNWVFRISAVKYSKWAVLSCQKSRGYVWIFEDLLDCCRKMATRRPSNQALLISGLVSGFVMRVKSFTRRSKDIDGRVALRWHRSVFQSCERFSIRGRSAEYFSSG